MRILKSYIIFLFVVMTMVFVSCGHKSKHDETLALYYKGVELRNAKQNEDAAKCFNEALIIVNDDELKANLEDRLGEIYWLQGLFDEALALHLEASTLFRQLSDSIALMKSLRNAGHASAALKKTNEAEDYYNEAFDIAKSLNDNNFTNELSLDLGRDIYIELGNYEKAISIVNQALENGAEPYQCHMLLGLAYYYLEDDANAIVHLNEAVKSDKAGARMSAYQTLSLIYQLQGDYQKALEYHELFNENMIVADCQHRSEELRRIKNESDLKMQENSLKARQKVRTLYFAGVLGVLVIALVITIILLRQRTLRSQLESEKTKNQFEAALKKNKVYVTALALTEQITASTLDFQLDNDSWDDFMNLINLIYNDLNNKLIAKYPSLTQEDLKICSLTRLGFSNQVIAILMNTQTASYARRKSRIKQEKMNGNEDARSFEEIIEEI